MALLTKQASNAAGVVLTFAAAAAGGDTVLLDDPNVKVHVRNGDASAKTVTIVRPGTTYGTPDADPSLSIPAAGHAVFGPFNVGDFADTNGLLNITYSAVTSVTVAVVRG